LSENLPHTNSTIPTALRHFVWVRARHSLGPRASSSYAHALKPGAAIVGPVGASSWPRPVVHAIGRAGKTYIGSLKFSRQLGIYGTQPIDCMVRKIATIQSNDKYLHHASWARRFRHPMYVFPGRHRHNIRSRTIRPASARPRRGSWRGFRGVARAPGPLICRNLVWRGVSRWNRVRRGPACWECVWRGPARWNRIWRGRICWKYV
jgi:hypothetical protein